MEANHDFGPDAKRSQSGTIKDGKFFAVIGYFTVLCLVPLLLKRNNEFAQFHGRQALVLFIFELAASMLKVVPVLGDIIFTLAWVTFGLVSLFAVVKVLSNKYWRMPIVFDIANQMTF
jgi:fumarate reductase subunit D